MKPPTFSAALAGITILLATQLHAQTLAQIPPLEEGGEWTSSSPKSLGGASWEILQWKSPDPQQTSPSIRLELKRYSAVPSPTEVARAYEMLAKRVSYAIDTNTRPLNESSLLLTFSNPIEKEQGVIKIMKTPQGILTAEARTSIPAPPSWDKTCSIIEQTSPP